MILGGGIIRSGGKTKYIMWIDAVGTWGFGVPLGLLAAFVWKLPIAYVYFILSLEECVRLGISLVIFRQKKWIESPVGRYISHYQRQSGQIPVPASKIITVRYGVRNLIKDIYDAA